MTKIVKFPDTRAANESPSSATDPSLVDDSITDDDGYSGEQDGDQAPPTIIVVAPRQSDASWLIFGALIVVAGLLGFLIASVG